MNNGEINLVEECINEPVKREHLETMAANGGRTRVAPIRPIKDEKGNKFFPHCGFREHKGIITRNYGLCEAKGYPHYERA